jgi:hypothetical protein
MCDVFSCQIWNVYRAEEMLDYQGKDGRFNTLEDGGSLDGLYPMADYFHHHRYHLMDAMQSVTPLTLINFRTFKKYKNSKCWKV